MRLNKIFARVIKCALWTLIVFFKLIKKMKQKVYTFKVKYQAKQVGKGLKVHGKSNATSNTIIGNHVNFNGMIIKGMGNVKIGNYFHSGSDCLIISRSHNYEGDKIPYDETFIGEDIIIEDFVWVGDRVIILPGVQIGEGAIIGAGSVVASKIPRYSIAGGNPASVKKYRDKKHFGKLKKEKKFH